MDDITIGGIPLNEENYLSFKRAYDKAVKEELEEFSWRKQPFLVSFAKYVLEEMETYPIIKAVMSSGGLGY